MARRDTVREALNKQLRSLENGGVCTLTGVWGSGKTYLWNELAAEYTQQKLSVAYASLFGVRSLEALRGELLSSHYTKLESAETSKFSRWLHKLKAKSPVILQLLDDKIGVPVLSRFVDPTIFVSSGTFVALDDIERVADSLGIEEVLGFANLLAEQRQCRVLLITTRPTSTNG